MVVYSYPENMLNEDISIRIANIMDQTFDEGFFTHSFENVNTMNYYFEIYSDWARGNKDMLMLSIIFEQQTTPEMEHNVLTLFKEFSEKLKSNEEIFTAFYINDINNFDDKDRDNIISNDALVKLWVKELYWATVEDTREKTEEEKIALLLNEKHIFLTLKKLSKGPITLEELASWFNKNFEDKNFDKMIEILVEKQIIFINQIGRVEKYVLLLKEVNAERIPPDSVIEYIDETPELIDLLLPKVQDYFNNYETKTDDEKEQDSLTLFKIISDPKRYNILSELREGIIQRDQLPKLVSKRTLDNLIEIIDYLKKCDVIEELKNNNERYIVLKTNLQISTSFPEYLRKLLPKESKPVIANKYSPRVVKQQEEMAEIFQEVRDLRDKEEYKTKEEKINKFLEDLSSSNKKDSSQK
jgi:DNA-binding transcriptional ArsR family regulator